MLYCMRPVFFFCIGVRAWSSIHSSIQAEVLMHEGEWGDSTLLSVGIHRFRAFGDFTLVGR